MEEANTKIRVLPVGQYVKSKSFEMYKSRQELAELTKKPETEFKLATVKEKLANENYEAALQIEVVAKTDEATDIFKGAWVSRTAGSLQPNPHQNRTCRTTASGSR